MVEESPLQSIVSILREHCPDLLAIYLFGSRASQTQAADSDWDLAVLVRGKVAPDKLWSLSGELATLLGSDVDLVDLRDVSTVMQYQIITTGKRLWAVEGADAGVFECAILSDKTELDTARAGLVADILETGEIYGR
ncbi:MAG: nucleotidyltransferase domain-containing protein [Myxococcales bacterium]|nr:nucleotidyltransferase domain-containing protein [Myxococcales bacterium]